MAAPCPCNGVAPRAGAWIETCSAWICSRAGTSRPVRARGLKRRGFDIRLERTVAPRAGAWIETCNHAYTCSHLESRPVRARGLKRAWAGKMSLRRLSRPVRARGLTQQVIRHLAILIASRPVRARGLKQCSVMRTLVERDVAPRAGAWIETREALPVDRVPPRRAPCGRVD